MYAIDIEYNYYYGKLKREKQQSSFVADVAEAGLSAGGVLAGAKVAKTTLAALNLMLKGAKDGYDKDFLFSQTFQVLLMHMEAGRTEIKNKILDKIKTQKSDYLVAEALSDLEDYYRAGTLAGALDDLALTAGKKVGEAKDASK